MLFQTFLLALGFNLLMFVPAYILKTDKLTDISYALTFVLLALYGFMQSTGSTVHAVLLGTICLWALRLGSYLLIRIRKMGKDKRFDGKRENVLSFASFWVLQGITAWVVLIPSIFLFERSASTFTSISIIGLTLWAIGLGIEAIADLQKYRFIQNKKNKGAWIDSGLWHYSRHPNYFGEILLWCGVYVLCVPYLSPLYAAIGLISPVYIATLIIFVSGIPLLEASAEKKWGENKEYQEYKKKTSILIPLPRR